MVEETRARSGATTLGDWHDVLIGGLVTLIMAIVLLAWPHHTVKVLLLLLGILAIISGLAALIVGLAGKAEEGRRSATIARGVVSLIFGVIVIARPGFALTVALILIGVWALVIGVLDINRGVRLHQSGSGTIVVSGAVWSLLGVLLLISAAVQKATWFVILLGVVLLLAGICRILAALVLRRVERHRSRPA